MNRTLGKVRCKHRHTIDEHPACFAQAEVEDLRKGEKLPWFKESGMKIGYLDIESDGLKADFSTMLSWCIKEKGGEISFDAVTKQELFDGRTDRRIISSILKEMSKYKIVVTYYGTGFDIPYIRAKALHYGLTFPSYSDLYHFDLYYTVKAKLCLSRKSLDNACDYLGIVGKTPINKDVWRRAKYGDKDAIREVLIHNAGDVEILEVLHDKLADFAKWTKRSV